MLGTIRVRLTSVLERARILSKIQDLARVLARYVCRLIGARIFRHEIRGILSEYDNAQKEVLDLKEDLDNSVRKNRLFRAIHELAGTVFSSPSEVVSTATRYGVDGDDVWFLYAALSEDDVSEIASFVLSESDYSDEEVLQILKDTSYLARRLVHRKLWFILAHDPMFESAEDLVGELHVAVLRVIREYEVQCTTSAHMTARVAKSVKNEAINLVEKHGREKRRVVGRVRESRAQRVLYHLDVQSGVVTEVEVFAHRELRQVRGGNVLVAVRNLTTREWMVVHHKRLYESMEEAEHARSLRLAGRRSKRARYADLAPQDIDDFQLNVLSIDVMDERQGARPFAETCAAEERTWKLDDGQRREDILKSISPRSRPFVELVFESAVDELFDAWCEDHGYNTATFDLAKMGRVACRYLRVTKQQLRKDLADTPAALWSDQQIDLILDHTSGTTVDN